MDAVKKVQSSLEYTTLGDIVTLTEIWYDPNIANSVIKEDRDFINFALEFESVDISSLSAWLLRIELHKVLVNDKELVRQIHLLDARLMQLRGRFLFLHVSSDICSFSAKFSLCVSVGLYVIVKKRTGSTKYN